MVRSVSFLPAFFMIAPAWGQITVATGQYDVNRTAANLAEVTLTPANVNASQFGLLFSRTVDGYIYAQPLYVPSVIIPPATTPVNVVYVATMNNSVYAFDADNPTASTPLWQVNLGTPVNITGALGRSFGPICGILSTPVIDPSSNTMYVVAMSLVGGVRNFQLHALDITTGKEKSGSPILIQARVRGSSPDSHNGFITFNAGVEFQRPALLLNAGYVWVMFGAGLSESISYHGWAMAYNAATLRQFEPPYCSTTTGNGAGIWMSGRGAAADANGVYMSTGNGSNGPGNCAECVLAFRPTGIDYFLPDNYAAMNTSDWDVSAGGPLLMPGTSLLAEGSKVGVVYVMSRTNLGHRHAGNTQIVQALQATPGCSSSSTTSCTEVHAMSYWARTGSPPVLYVWGRNDVARSFAQASNGAFSPLATNSTVANFPGGILSLSANGDTNGVVWATTSSANSEGNALVPGVLRALDAVTLSELWNSGMSTGDTLGDVAKFCIPVVANGKVYVATFSDKLMVYGLRTQ